MANEKRLAVIITANAKQAQKELGGLGDAAEKGGKRTSKALSGIQKGLVGLGVGAAAIGSFKAFEESEKVARQTEAVIKSTGGSAQVTSKHVGDLASEMSKLGGVDDELVQSGENMLLTFTNVRNEVGKGNDVFDQATLAANNYAAATGTDVVQANKMLGKALNDPIKGLTSLTRAGVVFTAQQKDQIKSLVQSGDTLGAQKIILAEFSKEYGGSLEANATASGKAQVAMENLGESAGAILAPGLELIAGAATHGAEALAELPTGAQQAIVGIGGIAIAAAYAGPKVVEMAGDMKDGAIAAKNWAGSLRDSGQLGTFTKGLGVAAAGVGAFTITLELLNKAAESGIDIEGLSTDLVQLGKDQATVSDLSGSLGGSVEDLAASFGKATESPHDFGEAVGYLASHFRSDWNGTDLLKAQNTVEDLDAALAQAVTSGNADEAQAAYGKVAAALIDQGASAEEVAGQLPQYWTELERADRANGGFAGAAVKAATATKEQGERTKEAGERTKQAAVSAERFSRGLEAVKEQAADATSAIRDYYDEATNQVASQIDVERSLDAVKDSFKENGTALSISAEAGRQNRESIIAAKDAQLEYAMTLRDTDGSNAAIESMVNYSNSLYDTLIQAGLTKDQASALIAEMKLTPTDIYTTFRSNQPEAELRAAAVKQSIEKVPGLKEIYFKAYTDEALFQIHALSREVSDVSGSVLSGTAGAAIQQSEAARKAREAKPGGKARGGPVKAGTVNLVGEHGPELVRWDQDGTVIPAGDTRRIMANSSKTWDEAGIKVGTVFEDGSVVTASDMDRYRANHPLGGAPKQMTAAGDGPGAGWDYRNGKWYDPSGRFVGTATHEDSAIYGPDGRMLFPSLDERRSKNRTTATFGGRRKVSGTSVNPGRPASFGGGGGGGCGVTVNVYESRDAQATAREVVAVLKRESRMGGSPLAGVR